MLVNLVPTAALLHAGKRCALHGFARAYCSASGQELVFTIH
jgi:hypothetical protein